jgi:hypothetical protein
LTALRPSTALRTSPQPRVPGNDRLRLDPDDHDQLLASGRARDKADRASRNAQIVGQEPEQRLVGRPTDRGSGNVCAEHAVDHAVDTVGPRPRSQTDGEADVGVSQDSNQAPQDAQHDEDDER